MVESDGLTALKYTVPQVAQIVVDTAAEFGFIINLAQGKTETVVVRRPEVKGLAQWTEHAKQFVEQYV